MPKNQKQVWIDTDQWQALRGMQDKIGIPIAESIRRAIREYLGDKPKSKKEAGK